MKEFNKAEQAKAPKDWDETCVLGHCGSPGGCERDMQCRANLAIQPTASNAGELEAFEAECLRLFGDLAYFDRDQYGNYKNIVVRAKFDGWMLARAALATKPPAGEQK